MRSSISRIVREASPIIDIEARLKAQALALGFATCGIAAADATPDAGPRLAQWLEEGAHGSMAWMAERLHHRHSPRALWPDANAAIMLGMSYAPPRDPRALEAEPQVGRISVYAQGQDYHDVIKKALKALARWLVAEVPGADVKVFVDTAPVMEKPLAAAAGIGWQGKHTNLLNRDAGNWLLLGCIMTTLPLIPDAPAPDRCGSCDACQRACPTDAFPAPYRLDARRCISYLTIEHKGPIPHEFRVPMGNRIYGCDDCLAACPWNKFAKAAQAHSAFLARAELQAPELADLLALDDASFRQIFAGSPIKRIGRDRMVRNCLIAAGNSGRPELADPVERLLADPDPAVRGAAVWALHRLAPHRLAAGPPSGEEDGAVVAEWAIAGRAISPAAASPAGPAPPPP